MVQTIKKNFKIVNEYAKKLKKKGVEKVFFFGSRFRGNFYPDSDFDILIVSKQFAQMDKGKRNVFAYQSWNQDFAVDFLCYTPEEFERNVNKFTVVNEAIKTGIEL